jgi:hypothetical protein
VITEHQVYRNLLKQIVVKLEIVQVNEFAAIAPGYVLGLGLIVDVGSGSEACPAIPSVRDYGFGFRHFCHSKSFCFAIPANSGPATPSSGQ